MVDENNKYRNWWQEKFIDLGLEKVLKIESYVIKSYSHVPKDMLCHVTTGNKYNECTCSHANKRGWEIGIYDIVKIGTRNDNGKCLINICDHNHLKLLNSFYQQKDIHKYTWTQNIQNLKSGIDYSIIYYIEMSSLVIQDLLKTSIYSH